MKHHDITGKTKIVGVFGYPISHSLSPAMHNAAFKYLNLDYIYIAFEVKPSDLKAVVKSIPALNISGINLTIPHKEAVVPYMDKLTREAELIGAVNTIEVQNSGLIGHNTDALGFIRSLREFGVSIKGKSVLLLGAGGASKGVGFALVLNKAKEICIANRTLEKAKVLASNLRKKANFSKVSVIPLEHKHLKSVLKNTDILINATSSGMKSKDPLLVPSDSIIKKIIVYDLIYNPPETKLIRLAKKKGCLTINGESMLVHQGAIAFEIWTKRKAPVEIMKKALRKALPR